MNGLLKYGVMVVICLLLGIAAGQADRLELPREDSTEYTYVSQEQIDYNILQVLSFLCSHTPREITTFIDYKISPVQHVIKYTTLLFMASGTDKATLKEASHPDIYSYSSLHPNPVGYYIYTLEKILI